MACGRLGWRASSTRCHAGCGAEATGGGAASAVLGSGDTRPILTGAGAGGVCEQKHAVKVINRTPIIRGSLSFSGAKPKLKVGGGQPMKINSLHDLYISELRDLYDCENRIVKALPKMAEAANSQELRNALELHLDQSREHISRLEQIFQQLDESPKGMKCKGIEGIIDEGEDLMDEDSPAAVCDAGLISSAQKVEHYEIAGYGTARTFAMRLGFRDQAELLNRTLQEEGETDKKLTSLAESYINEEARTAR